MLASNEKASSSRHQCMSRQWEQLIINYDRFGIDRIWYQEDWSHYLALPLNSTLYHLTQVLEDQFHVRGLHLGYKNTKTRHRGLTSSSSSSNGEVDIGRAASPRLP